MPAELQGYLGDDEAVIDMLRRAADAGLMDLPWLERCPLLDRARRDPRFAPIDALVRRRALEVVEVYRAP